MRTLFASIMLALAAGPVIAAETQAGADQLAPEPRYSAQDIRTVPVDQVALAHRRYAALAQYHRWFQLYENPAATLNNSLDILDENATVTSAAGSFTGRAALRQRFEAMPRNANNAHAVEDVRFSFDPDGQMRMVADVDFHTIGASGAGQRTALTYNARLRPSDTLLPKFMRIDITRKGEPQAAPFVSKYAENRVKSIVYYWLALVDNPNRDAEPFREIFAPDFALNFSVGKLDSFDKFKKWYDGPAAVMKVSAHIVNSLTYEEVAPNLYKAIVDCDWQGVTPDGKVIVGRVINSWIFIDNPSDRFARIQSVTANIVVPFQPKP